MREISCQFHVHGISGKLLPFLTYLYITHKHLCQVLKANFVCSLHKRSWIAGSVNDFSPFFSEHPEWTFRLDALNFDFSFVAFVSFEWMVMEGQYTISSRNSSLEDGLVGRLLPNFSLVLPFQLSHAFDWTIICIEKMYAARTILGLCFCWPILMTPEGCLIRQPQSTTRSGNYMRWYMIIFMFNRFIEPDPISFLGLWFQSIWFTNWHGFRYCWGPIPFFSLR